MSELTPEEIERIRKERAMMEEDSDLEELLREEARIKEEAKAELKAAAKASGETAKRLWGALKTKTATVSQNVQAKVGEFKVARAAKAKVEDNPDSQVQVVEPEQPTEIVVPVPAPEAVPESPEALQAEQVSHLTAPDVEPTSALPETQEEPQASPVGPEEPVLSMDDSAYGGFLDDRQPNDQVAPEVVPEALDERGGRFSDTDTTEVRGEVVGDVVKKEGRPTLNLRLAVPVLVALVVGLVLWGGLSLYQNRDSGDVEQQVAVSETEVMDVSGEGVGSEGVSEPIEVEKSTPAKVVEVDAKAAPAETRTATPGTESRPMDVAKSEAKAAPKPAESSQQRTAQRQQPKPKRDWRDDADKQLDELERILD